MTASVPPVDIDAARAAAVELVRVTARRRTHPADVVHLQLPLALEVLDHVGGDAVLALYVLADLVDPDHLAPAGSPAGLTYRPVAPQRPPATPPRLRVVASNPSDRPTEGHAL